MSFTLDILWVIVVFARYLSFVGQTQNMPHLRRIDKKIIQPRYSVVRAVKPAVKRRKDDGEPMAKLRKPDASHLQADIDDFIDPTVLERLDDWARGRGISRAATIAMAVATMNRGTLHFLGSRKNIWVTFAIRKNILDRVRKS